MSSGLLHNKVAVVTGGTKGIGNAVVELFKREGAQVFSISRTPMEADASSPNDAIQDVIYLRGDVSNPQDVRDILTHVKKATGKIDVLVNNAGVEFNELLGMSSDEHMHQMFEVNVYGTIYMTQYASRMMMRNDAGGSIINIASAIALKGNTGQSVYAASKGAVMAFTRSIAKELAQYGIRVNSVAPGLTDTGMLANAKNEAIKKRVSSIALGRAAKPEEIAEVCVFLASDRASYLTGESIVVDGCAL